MGKAVARKPKRQDGQESQTPTEADVQRFINQGGSVATNEDDSTEVMPVNIRPPVSVVREIDTLLSKRRVKISRHTWLMEAIIEKLERELK